MATATERAAVGAEEARREGRGKVGQAVEAARNVRAGRDNNGEGVGNNGTTVSERGLFDRNARLATGVGLHEDNHLGNTEEEFSRLRLKTHITHEGDSYCPNPNIKDLPREYETRVQVIQRYPEMKPVEKTDFIKEIQYEERVITVQRTRVVWDDVERIDRVPEVRKVPRTRTETHFRTVSEDREVVDTVQDVDYIEIPRIEMVPRVITEDVEERVVVPVVREVAVTRMVEVPTGNYCEAPAGIFVASGDFDLLKQRQGLRNGKKTSAGVIGRVSATDKEGLGQETNVENPDGTLSPNESARKKKSLRQRVMMQ